MQHEQAIIHLIENALREDVGEGDFSTLSTIDAGKAGTAELKIKEAGILAGVKFAETIFKFKDPGAKFIFYKNDGDEMNPGEIAFQVQTGIRTILECERLVLNCMQRMSGIATLTNLYVKKLAAYKTKLLDTRKTTPNFRVAEKEAVRIGGGVNHRFGLYDMIMLKDNHIDYCGGIEKAINKAWDFVQAHKPGMAIEIEARSLEDVELIMKTGKINRIMLDNFTPEQIAEALPIINHEYETEASGGIHYNNLEEYAATGVDYISSGAIIHQARSVDLSLKAIIS